jgi:phosphohistidine phosphatase SixA
MNKTTTLILMRHGSYEGQDLTSKGKSEVESSLTQLLDHEIFPKKILTSPLVRAMQTAEIALEYFEADLIVENALKDFNSSALLEKIEEGQCTLMVGHAPDLAPFANQLMGQSKIKGFEKGALCIISFDRNVAFGKGQLVAEILP